MKFRRVALPASGFAACAAMAVAFTFPGQHHPQPLRPVPTPTRTTATPTPSPVRSTPSTAPTTATPTSTPTSSPTATTPAGAPLPAALSGYNLTKTYAPSDLVTPAWANPPDHPGNCPTINSGAVVNSAGYAEIDTTGKANDCRSIESPTALTVKPGVVVEVKFNVSSFGDWPAVWLFGHNWPAQGEEDGIEGSFGVNYMSWHGPAATRSCPQLEISTNPWTYSCKQNAPAPVGANVTAPGWHTVDFAFTGTGWSEYYDGHLYDSISESVTTGAGVPQFITVSEGSCNASAYADNECANNATSGPAGTMQVAYINTYAAAA